MFLGIYYFYGILDRQQKIKKKKTVDFCCQGNKLFSPFKAPLVNLVRNFIKN